MPRAQRLLEDFERLLVHGQRLKRLAHVAVALSKVVERHGNGDVGLAERALADGEALFVERNRLLAVADPYVNMYIYM